MNNRTLKITYGAMLVAIFGVLLLINRQTGGWIQGVLVFILPVPIAAYAVKYGGRASLVVFVCMVGVSFLFGTFASIFYAIGAAILGLVLGTRLHQHRNMTHTMLILMVLAMIIELVDMTLITQLLTGRTFDQDILEVQSMMTDAIQQFTDRALAQAVAAGQDTSQLQANLKLMDGMLETNYLKRTLLVGIALSGVLQGFVVYGLTIMILRRLRIPVQKPTPLSRLVMPRWTGVAGLLGFLLYAYTFTNPLPNEILQNVAQILGITSLLFLLFFGMTALVKLIHAYLTRSRALTFLLCLFIFLRFISIVAILGGWYLAGDLRTMIERKERENAELRKRS